MRTVIVNEEAVVTPPPSNSTITIDQADTSNGECPGETIHELDNINSYVDLSGTGTMNYSWDVDRYHFTPLVDGTVNITLTAPQAMTLKAGSSCNTETFFRSENALSHVQSFTVSANQPIHLAMFDWVTNNYTYTLDIEFIPEGSVVTPSPITDTTPPVITLTGNNPMTITVGDTFNDPGATASDNVDGDISSSISATSNINTAIAGTYTITYTVNDTAGNNSALVRTVIVKALASEGTIYSKTEIGEMLFVDTSISKNRTQSCATCHNPDHGYIDDRNNSVSGAVSLGDDGISMGDRNSPTAAYAMFSPSFGFDATLKEYIGGQFLDGRAATLAHQAEGPPLNPVEMMMASKEEVSTRLQENIDYVASFKAHYGEEVFDDANTTYNAMADMIALYEKTDEFAPFDSKYDRYLKGEYEMTTLEKQGMDLFFASGATNCTTCHMLKNPGDEQETFTNYQYRNIGTPVNSAVRTANGLGENHIDHGLLENPAVTDIAHDGKYKTPTLRNIAVTAPYMHNGIFQKLRTVIAFYDQINNPERDTNPETGTTWGEAEVEATVSHDELIMQILTEDQIDALVAFLTTLTDQRYEHLLPEEPEEIPTVTEIDAGNIDLNEPANGECSGDLITDFDNVATYLKLTANGTMNTSWDVDRYYFTPAADGTLTISLSAPQAMTMKAGIACDNEQFFRSENQTSHLEEMQVVAGQSIYLALFDWVTNGYGYDMTFEFTPENVTIVANAGADQVVKEDINITLTGSSNLAIDYLWTQTGGPNVTLQNANRSISTFTAPKVESATTLTFELTATDSGGNEAIDSVTITVHPESTVIVDPDLSLSFERFGTHTFSMPVGLVQAPNSNTRWYVIELAGAIQTFDTTENIKSTLINIASKVKAGGEQGLLGLAFHPSFPTQPYAYLYYTRSGDGTSVISRFTSSDGGLTLNPESEQIILTVPQPYTNHNGGQISFGSDGYLYIGLGDGGSANDPHGNGQNTSTLLGAMLRIDVDGGDPYGIPTDNPFAENTKAINGICTGDCPEIYAWGLRNPWRWSFDKLEETLWVGDVGQYAYEEINIVEKGKNYGWRCKEGFQSTSNSCTTEDFIDPVTAYDHSLGYAVTGGYVYRGSEIPELQGVYLYADYVTGLVWGYYPDGTVKRFADVDYYISSFGEGHDGELYMLDHAGGGIYKVVK